MQTTRANFSKWLRHAGSPSLGALIVEPPTIFLYRGIIGLCVIVGAIVGVGIGALIDHTELLAGIGIVCGLLYSPVAISNFEKAAKAGAKKTKR